MRPKKVAAWTEGEDGEENHVLEIWQKSATKFEVCHYELGEDCWVLTEMREFSNIDDARTWAKSRI